MHGMIADDSGLPLCHVVGDEIAQLTSSLETLHRHASGHAANTIKEGLEVRIAGIV
jgi:hypothetical protein